MKKLLFLFCVCAFSTAFGQENASRIQNRIISIEEFVDNRNDLDYYQLSDSLHQALLLSRQLNDIQTESRILARSSKLALQKLQNFQTAIAFVDELRTLGLKHQDYKIIAEYHNGLGVIYYHEQNNNQAAFEEFKTALDILQQHDLPQSVSILNNYALALLNTGEPEKALIPLYKAKALVEHQQQLKNTRQFGSVYTNLGVAHMHLEQFDSTEYYLKKTVSLFEALNENNATFSALVYLGVFYQETGALQESLNIFERAEAILPATQGNFISKKLLFEGKSLSLFDSGDANGAYLAKLQETAYQDSLLNMNLQEQSVKYQFSQRLDSLQQLKEKETLNAQINEEKFINSVFLALIITIAIVSIALFFIYRLNKRNQVQKLRSEHQKLENEHRIQSIELQLLKSEERAISANLKLSAQSNALDELKDRLEDYLSDTTDPQFDQIKTFLNRTRTSEKRIEQLKFLDEVMSDSNNEFYDTLQQRHPNLTKSDKRLALLIKFALSSEELMVIFNISKSSLNTKRYRLRKKLELDKNTELDDYISDI